MDNLKTIKTRRRNWEKLRQVAENDMKNNSIHNKTQTTTDLVIMIQPN